MTVCCITLRFTMLPFDMLVSFHCVLRQMASRLLCPVWRVTMTSVWKLLRVKNTRSVFCVCKKQQNSVLTRILGLPYSHTLRAFHKNPPEFFLHIWECFVLDRSFCWYRVPLVHYTGDYITCIIYTGDYLTCTIYTGDYITCIMYNPWNVCCTCICGFFVWLLVVWRFNTWCGRCRW